MQGPAARQDPAAEAAMAANGFILVGLLAILFTAVVVRLRRRAGLSVRGKTIIVTVTGFVLAILALWLASSP
jgi:hypothetical protein